MENIDLRPLKKGDKAYIHISHLDGRFGIRECVINKVENFEKDGITYFRYKIKYLVGDQWFRTQHTYDLDSTSIDWSPYHIYSTPEKCMNYLIEKYRKEVASDIESFKKSAKAIGMNTDIKLLNI